MDNPKNAEIVRETLMKVLIGDSNIQGATIHALCNLGLIKKRAEGKKKVGIDAWLASPVTHFELTAKGLSRLQGDKNGI
jgi:hypothetical protein